MSIAPHLRIGFMAALVPALACAPPLGERDVGIHIFEDHVVGEDPDVTRALAPAVSELRLEGWVTDERCSAGPTAARVNGRAAALTPAQIGLWFGCVGATVDFRAELDGFVGALGTALELDDDDETAEFVVPVPFLDRRLLPPPIAVAGTEMFVPFAAPDASFGDFDFGGGTLFSALASARSRSTM